MLAVHIRSRIIVDEIIDKFKCQMFQSSKPTAHRCDRYRNSFVFGCFMNLSISDHLKSPANIINILGCCNYRGVLGLSVTVLDWYECHSAPEIKISHFTFVRDHGIVQWPGCVGSHQISPFHKVFGQVLWPLLLTGGQQLMVKPNTVMTWGAFRITGTLCGTSTGPPGGGQWCGALMIICQ